MTTTPSFWKRLENMVRGRGFRADDVLPALTHDTLGSINRDDAKASGSWNSWIRWGKPKPRIAELRESYSRLLELLDAVRGHFDSQDRRSKELTESVRQLGSALGQLVSQQTTQSESLGTLARQVDTVTKGLAPLATELPATMHAQAEAVRAVSRRLELAHETQIELVAGLQRFSQAGDALRASGESQVQMLTRLAESNVALQESLTHALRQQNRRITTLVIAVAAAGTVLIGGLVAVYVLIFAGS